MDDAEKEEEKEASVLEKFAADKELSPSYEETKLPKWLYKYLVYRFNLLDRTGEKAFLGTGLINFYRVTYQSGELCQIFILLPSSQGTTSSTTRSLSTSSPSSG